MPYTTASGVIVPASTDAYALTVDLKTMADKQATYENRLIVADDTARLALTTPELRDGLKVYVQATDLEYIYNGSVWDSPNPDMQHAEFTTSVSIADNTGGTMGTITADPTYSVNGSFAVIQGTGIIRLQAGLYAIQANVNLTAVPTGLCLLGFDQKGIWHRISQMSSGNAYLNFSHSNFYIAAQTDITFYLFQTTGATRTVTGRIAITKLG